MPVYETKTVVNADGTTSEEVVIAGEEDEPKDEDIEAEINTMIKDVELIEETTKTA